MYQPPKKPQGKIVPFHEPKVPEVPNVLEIKLNKPEGEGRYYQTGGFLCDLCPFCRGTRSWCPVKE